MRTQNRITAEFTRSMNMKHMITPTQHEKNEWSRFATWAYANGRNDLGTRYSMAATLRNNESCSTQWFDILQQNYRMWLCFGGKPEDFHMIQL